VGLLWIHAFGFVPFRFQHANRSTDQHANINRSLLIRHMCPRFTGPLSPIGMMPLSHQNINMLTLLQSTIHRSFLAHVSLLNRPTVPSRHDALG
jgi:hypothetical protein